MGTGTLEPHRSICQAVGLSLQSCGQGSAGLEPDLRTWGQGQVCARETEDKRRTGCRGAAGGPWSEARPEPSGAGDAALL